MTEDEIIEILVAPNSNHPAWESFCKAMKDKQYGYEPLYSAWYFFQLGWECDEKI